MKVIWIWNWLLLTCGTLTATGAGALSSVTGHENAPLHDDWPILYWYCVSSTLPNTVASTTSFGRGTGMLSVYGSILGAVIGGDNEDHHREKASAESARVRRPASTVI